MRLDPPSCGFLKIRQNRCSLDGIHPNCRSPEGNRSRCCLSDNSPHCSFRTIITVGCECVPSNQISPYPAFFVFLKKLFINSFSNKFEFYFGIKLISGVPHLHYKLPWHRKDLILLSQIKVPDAPGTSQLPSKLRRRRHNFY